MTSSSQTPALRGFQCAALGLACSAGIAAEVPSHWEALPGFPLPPGVAGAFGGIDNGALIVAGGSNFQPGPGEDLWAAPKLWRRERFVLVDPGSPGARWIPAGELREARGNGASASSPLGLVCLGGDDGKSLARQAFLLRWEEGVLQEIGLPDAPVPGACGAAAVIDRTVYYMAGQTGGGMETADSRLWALELPSAGAAPDGAWKECAPLPGPGRVFHAMIAQRCGEEVRLYVIGGRRSVAGPDGAPAVEPLREVFEYSPASDSWRRRADAPVAMMAAPAVPWGSSQVLVLGGDDGALMARTAEIKSDHPGFPRRAWVYDTVADAWADGGETPANQVASVAATDGRRIFLVAGEIKPRHRTTACWRITLPPARKPE